MKNPGITVYAAGGEDPRETVYEELVIVKNDRARVWSDMHDLAVQVKSYKRGVAKDKAVARYDAAADRLAELDIRIDELSDTLRGMTSGADPKLFPALYDPEYDPK